MGKEPFQPQWAELTEGFREARWILNEVLSQQADREQVPGELEHHRLEADRHRAIAAQQHAYIGRLESALWFAEEELTRLQQKYRALTEPVGRGRSRRVQPSANEEVIAEVDRLLWCAEQDREEAVERERNGEPSLLTWAQAKVLNEERKRQGLPPLVHQVVCGKEGLTVEQAVEMVLRGYRAADTADIHVLARLEGMIEARVKAIVQARLRRGKSKSSRKSIDR